MKGLEMLLRDIISHVKGRGILIVCRTLGEGDNQSKALVVNKMDVSSTVRLKDLWGVHLPPSSPAQNISPPEAESP